MEVKVNKEELNLNSIRNLSKDDNDILDDSDSEEEVPVPVPVQKQEEQVKEVRSTPERRILLMKIKQYHNRFKDHLKDLKHKDLEKKTEEELEDILKEIQLVVSNKNSGNTLKIAFNSVMPLYELTMVNYAGIRCQGISHLTAQDPQIDMILDEIQLEYFNNITYIKPEYRLIMSILKSTVALHSINTAKMQRSKLDEPLQQDTKEEYDDL